MAPLGDTRNRHPPAGPSTRLPHDNPSGQGEAASSQNDIHYTAFVRLPFPRGDFVDPPLVNWNAEKDGELWKILSSNPRSSESDWKALAARFDVTLPFLLQEAAWLYERQLSQVRAQMRNVSKAGTAANDRGTIAQGDSPGEPPRGVIGDLRGERRPSAVNAPPLKASGDSRESSQPSTPKPNPSSLSRNVSNNTVTQVTGRPASRLSKTSIESFRRTSAQIPIAATGPKDQRQSPNLRTDGSRSPSPRRSSTSSSSSTDSEEHQKPPRGQLARRPSRFTTSKGPVFRSAQSRQHIEEDEDDDESPAFLPIPKGKGTVRQDTEPKAQQKQSDATYLGSKHRAQGSQRSQDEETSNSSASSAAAPVAEMIMTRPHRTPGPRSPNHRVELSGLGRRGPGGKNGSDGTPSMGSSFSDLGGHTS